MNKKFLLLIGLLCVIVVVGLVIKKGPQNSDETKAEAEIIGNPLDVASDFYNNWLDAVVSTTTDPISLGLQSDSSLTAEVQQYIADNNTAEVDPVLCQSTIPPRIGAKPVFSVSDKAQFIMLPRGVGVTPQRAIVDVAVVDNAWKITKIECISGESAPEREFTFERDGFLLKNDAPPLDGDTWYVVYEEDGIDGHFAPLSFSADSICISDMGDEALCAPDAFRNAVQVTVKGEMSEIGVDVKRIEF